MLIGNATWNSHVCWYTSASLFFVDLMPEECMERTILAVSWCFRSSLLPFRRVWIACQGLSSIVLWARSSTVAGFPLASSCCQSCHCWSQLARLLHWPLSQRYFAATQCLRALSTRTSSSDCQGGEAALCSSMIEYHPVIWLVDSLG